MSSKEKQSIMEESEKICSKVENYHLLSLVSAPAEQNVFVCLTVSNMLSFRYCHSMCSVINFMSLSCPESEENNI